MKSSRVAVTGLVVLPVVLAGAASGQPVLWPVSEGGNGHYYEYRQSPEGSSWLSARIAAEQLVYEGAVGHLATLTSPEENQFVANLLAVSPGGGFAWLGAYQWDPMAPPGQAWGWITGEPWGYTRWAAGEPNDYWGPGSENYLAIWGQFGHDAIGTWNDEGRPGEGAYIVEYEPTFPDCNSNGIPDDQEIADGLSTDCNGNGVPDACEQTRVEPGFVLSEVPMDDAVDAAAIGDFDQDGDADVAVTVLGPCCPYRNEVRILLNGGDGSFRPGGTFAVERAPVDIVAADLDRDGDLDLATANWEAGTVSVLLNRGGARFVLAQSIACGTRPTALAAADLDLDGDVDLACVNHYSDDFRIFTNQGAGVFAAGPVFPTGEYPYGIAAGDLDRDGAPDLVTSDATDRLSIWHNNRDGTFTKRPGPIAGNELRRTVLTDLDADGDLDIAVAHNTYCCPEDGLLTVALNRGDGTFGAQTDYRAGSFLWGLAAADLDGDGDPDLAAVGSPDGLFPFLNRGDGTFVARPRVALAGMPFDLYAGDLDRDGRPDLVVPLGYAHRLAILLTRPGPVNNDCNDNGRLDLCDVREGVPDCNVNDIPDECDIATGYSLDCNGNGVPDDCDLRAGASDDCNLNSVPDECDLRNGWADCNENEVPDACEPDCDEDGLIDACELAGGEPDCNGNGVPDNCDLLFGGSQDGNENGIPDECEPAPCAASRYLPDAYVPGQAATVVIEAQVVFGTSAYAVEDVPPAGWVVGAVSEGGVFDPANGKVKWGPFFDNEARRLTYGVTPPADERDRVCFGPGVISVDGMPAPICGQECVEPCPFHPADSSADRRLVIDEVTAYAACWRLGCAWGNPPAAIPISYVTRAGALWKSGETYCCDPSQALPLLWVNCMSQAARGASAPGGTSAAGRAASARRMLTARGGAVQVTVTVLPAGAAAYAVEEALPPGALASEISAGGAFDPVAGRVRWGPFMDGQARELTYRVSPAAGAFSGVLSLDGADQVVEGISSTQRAAADADGDYDVDQNDFGQFQACISGADVPVETDACRAWDFDGDHDVDQSDFGVFQRCISGPGQAADPDCGT